MPSSSEPAEDSPGNPWARDIGARLRRVRRRTLALVERLSDEQMSAPASAFMSPLAWDLNHIAHFEQLWLVDAVQGRLDAVLERRFDAAETPRPDRAQIDLPSKAHSIALLDRVRAEVLGVLDAVVDRADDPLLRDGYVYRMVLQHEGQHQETMLQALDLAGLGGPAEPPAPSTPAAPVDDEARVGVAGGSFAMGTADRSRSYDNERPRRFVDVDDFEIERYPATNRRWRAFIEDDGYRRAELWSEPGDEWRRTAGDDPLPSGWLRRGAELALNRFGVVQAPAPEEPVQHICFWEAEAFARWCGGRLPTEAEWEKAAAWDPASGDSRTYPWGEVAPEEAGACDDCLSDADGGGPGPFGGWGPDPVGRRPQLASPSGVEDLFGGVYNWTASTFSAYPGFEAFPYREYSEVFFGDPYRVLRGGSWAAHPVMWRNSYRNWDLPQRRQLFAGVRVVYDS